jgi:hypothetical protein
VPDQQQGQITAFLEFRRQNDEEPFSALVPLIYKELRHLSHDHLRSDRPNHILQSAAFARRSIASTGGFGGCIADPVPFHCGRFAADAADFRGLRSQPRRLKARRWMPRGTRQRTGPPVAGMPKSLPSAMLLTSYPASMSAQRRTSG